MPKDDAILTLAPFGAELALRRGGAWSCVARLPGPAGDTRGAWLNSLKPLGARLSVCVRDAGCVGARVRVIYDSPSQQVDLVGDGDEAPCSVAEAEASAREAYEDEADLAVTATLPFPSKRSASSVIVAADHEIVTEAIRDLVLDAGLTPGAVLPGGVIPLVEAVESATTGDGPTATAVLGETASFLVVADGDRIAFSRRLSLSVTAMTNALAAVLSPVGIGPETISSARSLLYEIGVDRDRATPPESAISERDVVASLLPSVQRLQLELRQSLRFGVSEDHRSALAFQIKGQAARVPGLRAAISDSLGIEVSVDGVPVENEDASVAHAKAFEKRACLRDLGLVTPSEQDERRERTAKRCLIAGGAVAALMLGGQWMLASERVDELERQLNADVARGAAAESIQMAADVMSARAVRVAKARETIETHAPGSPSAAAVMTHITLSAPKGVVIRSFDVRRARESFVGNISGEVFATEINIDASLGAFERSLGEGPLLSSVRLRNVSRSSESSVRFEIGFVATPGPSSFGFDPAIAHVETP